MIANIPKIKLPQGLLKKLNFFTTVHAEGYPMVSLSALAAILLGLLWVHLFWLSIIFCIGVMFHFRKITRIPPDTGNAVLAPLDGVIEEIGKASLPDIFPQGNSPKLRMRIYNGMTDPNLVFFPCQGEIGFSEYHKTPLLADDVAFEERGETRYFHIKGKEDIHIVIQSPLLGKRLLEETQAGKKFDAGHELGMGRLVNICDVYLPEQSQLTLQEGQHLLGAETVLADLGALKKSSAKAKNEDNESS